MIEYITQEQIAEARTKSPVRFGPLGERVYKRTYSRTKRDGTQEDWHETCARVVNGNLNYVHPQFIEKGEAERLFQLMVDMEIVPAGRHLWATNIGNNTGFLNNCFGAAFTDKFTEHFEFTFMRLMEGGGVGANYSNLFINSREGTPHSQGKPWVPKGKKNVHIVCDDRHRDYGALVQLNLYEERFHEEAFWLSEEGEAMYAGEREKKPTSWHSAQASDVQTCRQDPVTGEVQEWNRIEPRVRFVDLLSKQYSADWDPRLGNGSGPLYLRVDDSREGWAEAMVLLLKAYIEDDQERDIVFDVSRVREYGALLKGFGGKASGPEALMLMLVRMARLLNERVGKALTSLDYMFLDHYIAMAVVSGGVRRSARMAMKYWKDADVFDFIDSKTTKPGETPSHWTTNISVVIDNKFLRALKRGDPHASEVYRRVCSNMVTGNGEPGFINASKMLEGEAPGVQFYATNPCVTGDTWVMTQDGPNQVGWIGGQGFDAMVDGKAYSSSDRGFYRTGVKPTFRLKTKEGYEVEATANHPIMAVTELSRYGMKSDWKELGDLREGDRIVLQNHQALSWKGCGTKDLGVLLGLLVGDGNIEKDMRANVDLWGPDRYALRDVVLDSLDRTVGRASQAQEGHGTGDKIRIGSVRLGIKAGEYRLTNESKVVNREIERTSSDFHEGFLQGYFTADGSVQGTQDKGVSVRLASSVLENLKGVQRMLSRLGIACTIYEERRPAGMRLLPDGKGGQAEYMCEADHELVISGDNLRTFQERVGFLCKTKSEALSTALGNYKRELNRERWVATVASIEPTGEKEVFDCQIEEANAFDANGIKVHNCGEITFVQYFDMYSFDVCCLGHINLDRVRNPEEAWRLMARFLIRATFAPVADERQKANVRRNRRIGVGFMGYQSWLVKNDIKYSEAADKMEVKEFFRKQKAVVDKACAEYAGQLRIPVPIKDTTLAPTGTINNLPGCTSSMQADYAKFLIRRVQYSNSDPELIKIREEGKLKVEPSRYAANTSVVEYVMVSSLFEEVVELRQAKLMAEGVPAAKARGLAEQYATEIIEDQNDLSVEDVLANQQMLQQEYADNSISVTINVNPERYREEDVMAILKHYLPNLKGVTMFPEWSMPQLPLERITYDQLMEFQMNGYPIERSQAEQACLNGACPIK